MIPGLIRSALAAVENLPGSTDFWSALLENAPGLGAVGLVVVLLFRTYWRAEDRDERAAQRVEKELESLRLENAQLREFISRSLMGINATVARQDRDAHDRDAQDQKR